MIMSDEFRRLQELAGIKEMRIGNPIPVKYDDLKIGDKLRVTKDVYYLSKEETGTIYLTLDPGRNKLQYTESGDIWRVESIGVFGQLQLKCIQGENNLGDIISTIAVKKLIDLGAFRYENK
jgi:hypothetical protein